MWRKTSTILIGPVTILAIFWSYCAVGGFFFPHDGREQSFALLMFTPIAIIFCAVAALMWRTMLKKGSGNRNSSDASDDRKWYIRLTGGKVYGPTSTSALVTWAEQGRIVPGNEVSEDKLSWRPAESIPELDMKWLVVAQGVQHGPYNRVAADKFLQSGKAPPGASLQEK